VLILRAGECFAPSLAGQKQQRQRGQQVDRKIVRSTLLPKIANTGCPTAKGNLRDKNDFLRQVSGTPAQTALGPTSPWKDLPITVVKPGIGQKIRKAKAKN